MSESKNYISKPQEGGSVQISEDVIASITAAAVKDVEGVYGLSGNIGSDIVSILGKKNPGKGVKLVLAEKSVAVECNIVVKYNYPILEIAANVQQSVSKAIEAMTGVHVDLVNVNICAVAMTDGAK